MNSTTQGRYEQYERRMRILGRILNWIIAHKLQLTVGIAICIAFFAFLAIVPGMFVGKMICPDALYGDELQHHVKAILSDVSYEFAALGEDAEWSDAPPSRIGTYRVRGVSKNGYGKARYSREGTFTVHPAPLSVSVIERYKTYGDITDYSVDDIEAQGLAAGDRIVFAGFSTEDVSLKEMLVSISEIIIVNSFGEDVSDCYSPDFIPAALRFDRRVIGVSSADVSKPYDGLRLSQPSCFISSGSLANGDSIEYIHDPASIITEPGSLEAKFSVRITDGEGRDVTENYKIDYHYGALTVVSCPLTISIPSVAKYYDGTPLTLPEYTVTGGSIVDGARIEIGYETEASITRVGSLEVVFSARIYDKSGRDLTDLYALSYGYPTLTVSPRPITVATADVTKVYDGKVMTPAQPFLSAGTLAEGDVLRYDIAPASNITDVGSVEARFTARVTDSTGADVTDQYDIKYQYGTLTVQKRRIEVKTSSSKKVYDGTPLKNEKFTVVSGALVKDHTLVVTESVAPINAGEYDNILYFAVKNKTGADVTENYDIVTELGKLEITYREITVRAENAKKTYDGTPLTSDKWKLASGSIASGQSIKVTLNGSQTDVGTSENVPTVTVTDKAGNDVTALGYRVTIQSGTLEVTQRSITLTSESSTKVYDGKPLTNDKVSCTSGSLVLDHYVSADVTGSQTEIGESNNYFTARILDKNDNDVTHNYKIQRKYGTLKVTPKGESGDSGSNTPSGNDDYTLTIPSTGESYTVFEVQFEAGGSTYLRHKSYGDYTGSGFLEAPVYEDASYSPLTYAGRSLYYSGKVEAQVLYIYRANDPGYDLFPYYANTSLSQVKNDNLVTTYSRNYSVRIATDCDYRAFEGVTCYTKLQEPESRYRAFVYENYLSVPESTRRVLAELAAANGISADSKTLIRDIQTYVQHAAKYNLNAAQYPSGVDQVVYFLTVAKEGVCQQYAASATMLYRMFGIPARYTVGYSVHGEAGVRTEVTSDQAHAWVEIYLDGIGWVAVEVTGSAAEGEGGSGSGSGSGSGECDGSCGGDCGGIDIGQTTDKLDNIIYAKVTAQNKTVLYLRELSYGNYTGTGWTHATPYSVTSVKPIYFAGEAIHSSSLYKAQSITIRLSPGTPYLLPYYTTDAFSSAYNETDIAVEFKSASYNVRAYTDVEYPDLASASLSSSYLTKESAYRDFVYENYLDVPEGTRAALLEIARKNGISADSKTLITDIQNYIRTAATYNAEVGEYPEGVDVAIYFLTVAREGYCQHFATAATLMYRAMGIPARYTCGFMVEMNDPGATVSVKGENAHAWVEVYVDGVGWVRIEATAALSGYPVDINGTEVLIRPDGKICMGIETVSMEKVYDGMPFDESLVCDYYITNGNLYPGDRLVIEYDSAISALTAQSAENSVAGYKVYDKNGNDVTENYILDIDYGTLVIRQREITIASIDATKAYDGTELVANRWWLAAGSLAKGHVLEVTFTASIKDVGTVMNSFSYQIYDSNGMNVTSQYKVTKLVGFLSVTPAQ